MQSKMTKDKDMLRIKKIIAQIAFKHQETIDCCAGLILKRNKILDNVPLIDNVIYEILSNEDHVDRIVTQNKGPLLCFREHGNRTVAKIVDLISTDQSQLRKAVYDHFAKMRLGYEIGYNSLNKLKLIEEDLFSDNWTQSAIMFCDIINTDWLCNLMGLQQANEIRDEKGVQEFATSVFRPSIMSAESIGIGALQPSYAKDGYTKDFSQIYKESSDLNDLLNMYFHKYGHVPLCYDYSLYSMLNDFFENQSYDNQQKWDSLWKWADSKQSPIARYHVCCYFVRNSNNVSDSQLKVLYDEILNIIYIPVKENSELQWTSAWRLRNKLARHFGMFLESRLPGASSEKIYSHAWWMTEKIASIYGNNPEAIGNVRKYTIDSEESMSNLIWQILRPRTQSSSLRYATLMTNSLWAISLISQMDDKFLDYICRAKISNKELFLDSVLCFLLGCFPLKNLDEKEWVYAYDKTCIDAAIYLSERNPDAQTKEKFSVFVSIVNSLADTNKTLDEMKNILGHKEADQFLISEAMGVMVYNGILNDDDNNKIWESICNEEWLVSIFGNIKKENIVNSIIVSLMEIILQKQDKWAWQLPHLFSIVCQNNISNEKIKTFAFGYLTISSICSDTCSALKRSLLYNKSELFELKKHWSERLKEIYQIAPESIRARLRPVLLCFDL